jgi:hypothetical protein
MTHGVISNIGTISATGTAAKLTDAGVGCDAVLINCWTDSPASLLVGNSAAQVIEVAPGEDKEFAVATPEQLYVKAKTGSSASGGWMAIRL